jgi:hypothetical protein
MNEFGKWRSVVRKRLQLPISLQYILLGIVLWILVDWGTAGGFRFTYIEKYGPTLLLFYLGYPIVFSVLVFKLNWSERRLFIATIIAIFIIEVIFTRNPLIITYPALILGIPLAIIVYSPLTYFPLWIVRKELFKHKILIIVMLIVELFIIFLTTFGKTNS